tara:strand:+ start:949 stop:1227 length:279 start_codon:yes stop_codon:yes gene_type:complete
MKITKNQLRKLICEELQSERMDVGASPEEIEQKQSEISQAVRGSGGDVDRKRDADLAKEIEGLLLFGKSARHHSAMPDALDKIADLLLRRKG